MIIHVEAIPGPLGSEQTFLTYVTNLFFRYSLERI